ncbi:isopeptide-forming domain-containing fimbrial protein [Erysipelotrichaceae bacterium 66-17]
MKLLKKILGGAVAFLMFCAIATPSLAAKVTVSSETGKTNLSGREFTAYQIFTGRKDLVEGKEVLSDVQWGTAFSDNKNKIALLDALQRNTLFANKFASLTIDKPSEIAKAMDNFTNVQAVELAKIVYNSLADSTTKKIPASIQGTSLKNTDGTYSAEVSDGYYLIVDETTSGSVNPAVLQVVGDITITPKTQDVDVTKTVKDGEDGLNNGTYGDSADYSIGDTVPFRLAAQVPDMTHYDTYKFEFVDTLSTGLTLDSSSIKVYWADTADGENKHEITTGANGAAQIKTTGFTENPAPSFKVNLPNLKTITYEENEETKGLTGKYIIVEYNAEMNSNAAFREENKVKLIYSNNPNTGGDGETTEKKVYVFDFTLEGFKKDGTNQNKNLLGAGFIISRNVTTINEDGSESTKKQYAEVNDDKKITGWADWDGDTSKLPGDLKDGNITSGDDGKFTVIGLDAGKYELYEVKAPAGYNTPSLPFELEIIAEHSNDAVTNLKYKLGNPAINSDTAENDGTITMPTSTTSGSGIVSPRILNNKGTTLPETGGMGTTLLYVAGGILLIGSAVLLVTKKRMGHEN